MQFWIGCFALVRIALFIFTGSFNASFQELFEAFLEMFIGELFAKHWCQTEGQVGIDTVIVQVGNGVEQRHIGLRHTLINAFFTEGPHACLFVIRQMAVQHKNERADAQGIYPLNAAMKSNET
ncbi:MAG: hypothetical protein BWY75_02650 [bacterium ADurb.Bin425]|nr:MAG: hypothetical protein BWY75_02650 [bacterium ADurb.Bin425]